MARQRTGLRARLGEVDVPDGQRFVLRVREVFSFSERRTIIVGTLEGTHHPALPAATTVVLAGKAVGSVWLTGERMPGPDSGPGERSFETGDAVDWERDRVEAGDYVLRW